jgi:hypothetical protein
MTEVDTRVPVSSRDYFRLIVNGSRSELNVYFTALASHDPHPAPYECYLHFVFYGGKADIDRRFRVDRTIPSSGGKLSVLLPLAA